MPAKRNRVSEGQRKEIRDWWRSQDPRPRHRAIATWFLQKHGKNISQSTICDCLKERYDYLDGIDAAVLSQSRPSYRSRPSHWPILEERLSEWQATYVREGHGRVTGDMLMQKAKEIWLQIPEYQDKQPPEFSSGWLSRFKERHMLAVPRSNTKWKREQVTRTETPLSITMMTTAAPPSVEAVTMPEMEPPAIQSMSVDTIISGPVSIQRPAQRRPVGLQQSYMLESTTPQPFVNSTSVDSTEEVLSMRILCRVYKDEDIFSMSETALFWRKAPLSSLQTPQKQNSKVTLMMCTNHSGSERLPLWIIGSTARPRSLVTLNMKAIGVCWCSSKKGTEITPDLMKEWLLQFYEYIGKKERSVLLLLDRQIVSHTVGIELAPPPANIRIQWLPFSSTTNPNPFQPFDHGISRMLREVYRSQWLRYILESKRQSADPFATVSLYHAIHWAIHTWLYEISDTSIHTSFSKAINATKPVTSGTTLSENPAPSLEPLYNEIKRLFVKDQRDVIDFNTFLALEEDSVIEAVGDREQNSTHQRRVAEENEETDLAPICIPTIEEALQSVQVLMCFKEHQSTTSRNDMKILEQWNRELVTKTQTASSSS